MATPPSPPRPILILGPTAGGKSELAVRLAQSLPTPGEVISADSMQVYRHLDAGTAKPTPQQRARAPHHLIDVADPRERFTVADWLRLADHAVSDITARGRRAILVGGTHLYVQAFLEGLFEGPPIDADFRAQLALVPAPELHARLALLDPSTAQRLHPNDHKKLVRALEVHRLTGKPLSEHQTQWTQPGDGRAYRHDPVILALAWPVEAINRRINLRVKAMFFPAQVDPELAAQVTPRGESLIDETRRLEASGLLGPQAREALGYKQVLAALRGEMSLDDAFERTKVLTRRFAKTQRTWLKRFREVHWLQPESLSHDELLAHALRAAG